MNDSMNREISAADPQEKLIRVLTSRRGVPVELQVHYAITRTGGFEEYQLLSVTSTGTY